MTAREAFYEQRRADLCNRIAINEKLEESYRQRGEVRLAHSAYKEAERLKRQFRDLCAEFTTVTVIDVSDAHTFTAEGTI